MQISCAGLDNVPQSARHFSENSAAKIIRKPFWRIGPLPRICERRRSLRLFGRVLRISQDSWWRECAPFCASAVEAATCVVGPQLNSGTSAWTRTCDCRQI